MRFSLWSARALPIALVTLALLLAASLALPSLSRNSKAVLAARYDQSLATASGDEIPGLIAALAQLQEAGLPALLRSLTSQRPELSQPAAVALAAEVQSWKKLPANQGIPRLAQLLHPFAEDPQTIPLAHQPLVRQWAILALTWPQDARLSSHRSPQITQLLADSERILQTLPSPTNPEGLATATSPVEAWPAQTSIVGADLPGGNLPISPATSEDLPTGPVMASRNPREPNRITPDLPPVDPLEPRRFIAPRVPEVPHETRPDPTVRSAEAASATGRLSDLELMQDLNSAAANDRLAAARELRLRGYQPLHLAIAAKMTHPEATQRRKLVEELPRLGGINPAPWLKYLSEDEDAGVRQAAKAILATGTR